jgi:hypothetical protein
VAIAHFWTLDAECLRLTVDALAGSALVVDDVIERAVSIEQGPHQPAFLPIGVFDTASPFGELGMLTDLARPFRKEQGTAKALSGIAIGVLKLVGGVHTQVSFDSFSCRNCGDMRHGSKLAKICVSLSVEDWPCFMALPRLPRLPTSGLSAPIWKRSPQPTFQ